MDVLYFGEERDGSPHDSIIKLKKNYEKVFTNVKLIFQDNRYYLNKFIILFINLDNAENLGEQIEPAKNVTKALQPS